MRNRHYTVTGMGGQNFNDLEDNSSLDISGMGAVTINGSIGQHVSINKSGMGVLNVNGTVDPTAKFNISGMGAVNFRSRPPQAVLDNLEFSGMGTINVPGGYQAKSPTYSEPSYSYSSPGSVTVHGGVMRNVIIDGSGIRYTDANGKNIYVPSGSGTVNVGNTVYHNPGVTTFTDNGSTFNFIGNAGQQRVTVEPKPAAPVVKRDTVSDATQSYLEKIRKQTKFSIQVDTLKLKWLISPAQQELISKQLEKFNDPIMQTIMDEPVILNGRAYDLSTLIKLPVDAEGFRKDPYLTFKFNLQNLQPAWDLVNELQEKLTVLNKTRPQATVAKEEEKAAVLQGFSSATQAYIDSFKNKSKNTVTYNNILMNQTGSKTLDQFQEFFDPVSLELMNIPVAVNGNIYDLQTLLNQPERADGQREEPFNAEYTFYLRDIQPARHLANSIQRELEKLRTATENASKPLAADKAALIKPAHPEADILRNSALATTSKAEQEVAALQALMQQISLEDSAGISTAPHAVLFPPHNPETSQQPAPTPKSENHM